MATDPETTVRAMLNRAGVTGSDEEVGRLVAAAVASSEAPSPGRTIEPHLIAATKGWRK